MTTARTPLPAPTADIPTAGEITLRVRYCECDPMGVAHHAAFVPWLEMARTELLRDCGVTYAQLEAAGVFLVVAKLDVRYRRPGRYDDLLAIRTRVTRASRVKLVHEYEVRLLERTDTDVGAMRGQGEDLLVVASTTLACVGADARPRHLPDWLAGEDTIAPGRGVAPDA